MYLPRNPILVLGRCIQGANSIDSSNSSEALRGRHGSRDADQGQLLSQSSSVQLSSLRFLCSLRLQGDPSGRWGRNRGAWLTLDRRHVADRVRQATDMMGNKTWNGKLASRDMHFFIFPTAPTVNPRHHCNPRCSCPVGWPRCFPSPASYLYLHMSHLVRPKFPCRYEGCAHHHLHRCSLANLNLTRYLMNGDVHRGRALGVWIS